MATTEGETGAACHLLVVAVGCSTHALVDSIQRVLSLAGLLQIEYSPTVWISIDHRAADLQNLFFNEPWFLLEGLGSGSRHSDGSLYQQVAADDSGSAARSPRPRC